MKTRQPEADYDTINDARAHAQNVMELVALIQAQKQFLLEIFAKASHPEDPTLLEIFERADACDRSFTNADSAGRPV